MEQKIPPYWSRYIDNIDIKMLDIPNKKDLINNILVFLDLFILSTKKVYDIKYNISNIIK